MLYLFCVKSSASAILTSVFCFITGDRGGRKGSEKRERNGSEANQRCYLSFLQTFETFGFPYLEEFFPTPAPVKVKRALAEDLTQNKNNTHFGECTLYVSYCACKLLRDRFVQSCLLVSRKQNPRSVCRPLYCTQCNQNQLGQFGTRCLANS